MFRYALVQIPPLSGVMPGSDRDLGQTPLNPQEENAIEWVKAVHPKAIKQIRRHGMAFDRDLWEAWERHRADPQNVEAPPKSAYAGNWYECIDCNAKHGRSVIRTSFMHGHGVMVGERREFVATQYDPTKWVKGQQGADVDVKRAITIYTGWICPACERARFSDNWKKVRGERDAAKKQESEQLSGLLNEPVPQPQEQMAWAK
jgi:hypothetical protein